MSSFSFRSPSRFVRLPGLVSGSGNWFTSSSKWPAKLPFLTVRLCGIPSLRDKYPEHAIGYARQRRFAPGMFVQCEEIPGLGHEIGVTEQTPAAVIAPFEDGQRVARAVDGLAASGRHRHVETVADPCAVAQHLNLQRIGAAIDLHVLERRRL